MLAILTYRGFDGLELLVIAFSKRKETVMSAKEFFPPWEPTINANVTETLNGHRPVARLADGLDASFNFAFIVPSDVSSISSIQLVWSTPATSGNLYYDAHLDAAANGEAIQTHHNHSTGQTAAAGAVANEIDFLTLPAGLLTSVTPGDICGLEFIRLGSDANDTLSNRIDVYGIIVTFT